MDKQKKTSEIRMDRIEIRAGNAVDNGTRRGEIIDIDGNHFEFRYVEETDENVSTTEVILANPDSMVNTITGDNEEQICFHQNVIYQSGVHVIATEAVDTGGTMTQSQDLDPVSLGLSEERQLQLQNPQLISGLFQQVQELQSQPTGEDDRIFQLGSSGQFLRLAVPRPGEDPLRPHEFFLSDLSTGQFMKLPELGTSGPEEALVEKDPLCSDTPVRTLTETSRGNRDATTDPEIITVTIDDGNNNVSKPKPDGTAAAKFPGPEIKLVSKQFLANTIEKSEQNGSNLFPNSTINIPVPGGLSFQMQRYIFTQGLCRVCLLVKDNMVSLFEDVLIGATGMMENNRGANSSSRFNLLPAIKTLLDVDVRYGDLLPDKICMDCLDSLTAFSIFRKRISLGQIRLCEILNQVKNSVHPTVIPPLGELDMSKTGVFRQADSIISAKKILSSSKHSHFVVRNLSDRIWDKIFVALSNVVGYKSGKLKELESYCLDTPYVTGWFCLQCNITIHGPRELYVQHFQAVLHDPTPNLSSNGTSYPCDICGNCFCTTDTSGNSENYAEHWLQHFFFCECDICGKRMPSMKGVWVHKRSAHVNGDKLLGCSTCDKTFAKKAHLLNHERTHLNPEERKNFIAWCEICEKYLTGNLAAHIGRIHSEDRPWKCEHCGKTFKRKDILNSHRDAVHLGSRRYHCDLCGEYLKTLSSRRLHLMKHKGEKPHVCDICDKRFYTTTSLKSHVVKHKEVADIVCSICNKAFKRKVYLVEHMRLHSDEKYECPICHKLIRMKSNYFKHLGIHKKREKLKLASSEKIDELRKIEEGTDIS